MIHTHLKIIPLVAHRKIHPHSSHSRFAQMDPRHAICSNLATRLPPGVYLYYDNKPVELSYQSEEVAVFYAQVLRPLMLANHAM